MKVVSGLEVQKSYSIAYCKHISALTHFCLLSRPLPQQQKSSLFITLSILIQSLDCYPFTELFLKLTGECCCNFRPVRCLCFFSYNHHRIGLQFCVLPESKGTLDSKAKMRPAFVCCFSEVWKNCDKGRVKQGFWGNVAFLFRCNSHLFIRVLRILKFG